MTKPNPSATAPLDRTHADCVNVREWIRHHYALLTARAAVWQPRDMPTDWRP